MSSSFCSLCDTKGATVKMLSPAKTDCFMHEDCIGNKPLRPLIDQGFKFQSQSPHRPSLIGRVVVKFAHFLLNLLTLSCIVYIFAIGFLFATPAFVALGMGFLLFFLFYYIGFVIKKIYNNTTNHDISNISDIEFRNLILGFEYKSPSTFNYSLEIMSDYLTKTNYGDFGRKLESAIKIYNKSKENIDEAAHEVYRKLNCNQSQLLKYGYQGHSMLLNIVPDPSSDQIVLEIYNSGNGLSMHEKHPEKEKYQTQMKVQVPKNELTLEKISQLLGFGNLTGPVQAYGAIFSVPGATIIPAQEPIWQSDQKGPNCSLECINAFLRNNMTKKKYDEMRLNLFELCREGTLKKYRVLKGTDPAVAEFDRKIRKREARLYPHTPRLESSFIVT